jgi:hypothetical protein
MTFSIMPLSIKGPLETLSMKDPQHKNTLGIMALSIMPLSIKGL